MVRNPYPKSGPLPHRLILLGAALSATLGAFTACGKKNETPSWRLTPPILETTEYREANEKTSKLSVSAKAVTSGDVITNDSASLRFAPADLGLAMQTKSVCETIDKTNADGVQKTDEFEGAGKTSGAVSILRFLPPVVLTPESLTKNWTCQLHIRVTNPSGSSHGFSLPAFKLDFKTTRERIATSQPLILGHERAPMTFSMRRLVCSSWWIDVMSGIDLTTAARSLRVNGIDTRNTDRQPLCTVLDMGTPADASPEVANGAKPQITGFFQAKFSRVGLVWSTESLMKRSSLGRILESPIARFTVRNNDRAQVIAFLPHHMSIKVSVLSTHQGWGAGWTHPLSATVAASIEGAEIRQSSLGTYIKLAPNGAARISLIAKRGPTACLYDRLGVTHVLVTATTPIRLRTLAGSAIDFQTSIENLDSAARDEVSTDEPALLSTLVSQAVPASDDFKATSISLDEAKSLTGSIGGGGCVSGPVYDMSDLTLLKYITD